MAAIATTSWALLRPGDHVITSAPIYGGTHFLFENILPQFGVTVTQIPCGDGTPQRMREEAERVGDKLRMLYIETPANPSNSLVDIEAVASLAKELSAGRERRVVSAVDNTFLGNRAQCCFTIAATAYAIPGAAEGFAQGTA